MRVFLSLALGLLALAAATIPIGCNTSDCKAGTIAMKVYLNPPIDQDADRVIITSIDPVGLDITANVSRTAGVTDGVFVDLAFPHGYRANAVVTIVAQAFAGPVLIGQGQVTIHTVDKCSDGIIYIGPLMDVDAGS